MFIGKGSRGLKVEKLQYRLGLKVDGVFGSETETELILWQEKNDLITDGLMGNRSWNKMFGCNINEWTPIGIVIHSMSEYIEWEGKTLTAKDFLKEIGLSVHGFVHPNGKYEGMQFTNERAKHAGVSKHNGLSDLNKYFLGFEVLLKGTNSYGEFVENIQREDAYTVEQISASTLLLNLWKDAYKIPLKDIVRHSDISGDGVRGKGKGKVDPGSGFPYEEVMEKLRGTER